MREISSQDRDRSPYTYFELLLDHRSAVIILSSLETDVSLSYSTHSNNLRVRELAIESMLMHRFFHPSIKQSGAYALNYEEVNLIGRALLEYEYFDLAQGTFLRLNSRFVRAGGKDNVEMREIFGINQARRLR